MKLLKLFIFALSLIFITACSDKPSNKQIELIMAKGVESEFSGLVGIDSLKISDVKKVDKDYSAYVSLDLVLKASEKRVKELNNNPGDYETALFAQSIILTAPVHKYKKGFVIESVKNQKITLVKKNGKWEII